DLILLVLRCLIVGLFAMALARPALRSATSFLQSRKVTAAVVLDHSGSLGAGDGTATRFDLARQAAEQVVDAFPQGSSVAVLFSGDRVTAPIAEPSFDPNLVRKTLREASPSEMATDHAVGVGAALEALEGRTALRKEIVLVTDRQASGWRRLAEIEAMLRERSGEVRLRVVFVGDTVDENLAIASLGRSPGFVPASQPVRFDAEIANRGAAAVRQVRATLHVDEGPPVDESVLDVLAPGEVRRVTLFGRMPSEGFHAVSVRLPPDKFPADDRRTMVVEAVNRVKVLVVDGDPESNAGFFLRHALRPVPADVAADYYLQPQSGAPGQLGVARLSDFDAVVLADVPPLPPTAVDQLGRYVREGGALLVFPGPQAAAAFYNGELSARAGLLPATLGALRGRPDGDPDASGLALQASGYQHPVFALWNESGAGSLASVRFRAAWELVPRTGTNAPAGAASDATVPQVMLRFSDGVPAVMETGVGRGKVVLFSSTAGTAWNDLAVRPAFVPILHRTIASIADARGERHNVRVGGQVSLRQPAELAGRDVTIAPPGSNDRRWTRTLRAVPGASLLEWEDTLRAGAYRVTAPGGATTLAMFAAQPDPAESDMTELGGERRAELERVAQVVDWEPGTDLRTAFDRERVGVELWLPLAVAVFLLGLTEVWLAQYFSRPK
ncbi:MAG: VWA domain-containing protein, partial [Verrucomicrobiales bacterium]|nr:VWA domain-containing protein [Verrucomicrobiales bacterium]